MPKKISPDTILDIVGNDTRRRILSLLASKPHYASQLSRALGNISITAVNRHLRLLEKTGIITPLTHRESAPEKRYYSLNTPIELTLSLTPKGMLMKLQTEPTVESKIMLKGETLPVEFSENLDQALNKIEELRKVFLDIKEFIAAQSSLTVEANIKVGTVEDLLSEIMSKKKKSNEETNPTS